MSSKGLVFDEKTSRYVEELYAIPDMVRRRRELLRMLSPKSGERVIDVGSGPGFVSAEIAAAVGPSGFVLGVDSSDVMLGLARRRCSNSPWVEFKKGEATELPVPSDSFDAGIVSQVYEYVQDFGIALGELYRVLCRGGRALILDTDFDSLVWHSSNQELMDRVLRAFDEHCVHPHIARALGRELKKAGFSVEKEEVFVIFDTTLSPEKYSEHVISLVEGFVPGRRGITKEDASNWAHDLRDLGKVDEYFFSMNQYMFLARK